MRLLIGCAPLLAALAGAACSTIKSPTLNQLQTNQPERVWVTQNDQSVVLLYEPKVVSDTLVGYVGGRQRAKLPSEQIQRLRVREPAPTRTILLAAGLVVGFAGVLYAVSGDGPVHMQAPLNGGSADCLKHPDQPGCNGGF